MRLQDFVKLAKWEDRGYYAQQQATEKAQRQLLKLVTRTEAVLAAPAGPVLAAAAASASQPQEHPGAEGAKAQLKPSMALVALSADQVRLASYCLGQVAMARPVTSCQGASGVHGLDTHQV